jgi:outer membrane receptor protein involved in Fe transport
LLRSGDLLEFVPGLVATQHSGSGKANQYFLRGFNLDHGTDFSTSVDGMPINMPTHGHGQGWSDLNFLIPEAVHELSYAKGVYTAEAGDFSSAGAARFTLADTLDEGIAELSLGSFGHLRGVLLKSGPVGTGNVLLAGEVQRFDGPWTDIMEKVRKTNAMVRYSAPLGSGTWHLTAMAYANRWRSPDQIPERAVDNDVLGRFGSIDLTLGGRSSRLSLSGGWSGPAASGELNALAYFIRSKLNLFSNFTYFLDDPVNGDQFRQVDDRSVAGFELGELWNIGRSRLRLGVQGRFDDIGRVGLYRTREREPVSTVREDSVRQGSLGTYANLELPIGERLRTTLGVRYDMFWAKVDARSLPVNGGSSSDGKLSLKANLAYRVSQPLELYASFGEGFHSNDARGTTIRRDPVTGEAADQVPALVGSRGAEIGARWFPAGKVNASLVAWTLDLGSELLFVGDAGGTEASRPSRRQGIELGVYLLGDSLSGELELSYTRARFRDADPAGTHIPGSIPLVISGGVTWKLAPGWAVTPRVRYVGSYPLIEDASTRADPSLLVNLRLARDWQRFGIAVDLFNLLDRRDQDVAYLYPSRLPGEALGGVEDIHSHVFQPRGARLTVRKTF